MRSPRRRLLDFLGLGLSLTVLGACSGPTYVAQQYDGDPRPKEEIAVVRVNAKDSVLLDSLDGEAIAVRLPEDSRLHVEVLPGSHRVGVANALDVYAPAQIVSFVAEPNRVYRPVWRADPPPASARIYEVDRDSDALLRDVTAPPPPPPRAEPPAVTPPAPAPAPPPEPSEPVAPDPSSDVPDTGSDSAPVEDAGTSGTDPNAPSP
jgi:hypothetical protein